MSAQHTPGPWIVAEGDFGNAEFVITTDQREDDLITPICEMDIYFDDQIGVEQKANARLIAAAPAMLQALRVAKSAIEMDIEDYQADLDIINDAITLATGEQA